MKRIHITMASPPSYMQYADSTMCHNCITHNASFSAYCY